jgi:uncharacterized protein (DUF2235 family)
MLRNLVLCADGTCNAFGLSSSNVARVLQHIELQNPAAQVVCYDQGIGTRRSEHARIQAFKGELGQPCGLHVLDAPGDAWTRPWTWPFVVLSMTAGLGLKTNVGQLYVKLAELYAPGDRVFLFGFSRGAFTVRTLAALIWRYGLPVSGDARVARDRFAAAWPLYTREFPDEDGAKSEKARRFFNAGGRSCPIHFAGLWDTVKSYGGLRPRMLPHLRHNPTIGIVRHALALDEQRAWFEVTTWGWLDSDRTRYAAAPRLTESDRKILETRQDVVEVWFDGCHSDIGGGGSSERSSSIALRWMLGEAGHAGLKLNAFGRSFQSMPGTCESAEIEESRSAVWKVIDLIPRLAITNAERWPRRYWARPGASPREPLHAIRDHALWYHESVADPSRFGNMPGGVKLLPRPTLRTSHEE